MGFNPVVDVFLVKLYKDALAAHFISGIPPGVGVLNIHKAYIIAGHCRLNSGETNQCIYHTHFVYEGNGFNMRETILGDIHFLTGKVTQPGTDCAHFAGQRRIFLHTILNPGHVYAFRHRIQPFLSQNFFNFCVGCTDLQCNFIYPFRQSPGDCCDLFFGVLIADDSHTIIISFALLYFCIQLIRIRRNDQWTMHYRKVNGRCASLHGFGVANALFFGVPKRMISVTSELIGSQIFIQFLKAILIECAS